VSKSTTHFLICIQIQASIYSSGTTVSRDVTWFLRKYGYWPSYNIPYLQKISELSGFNVKGNINNWWRWGYTPRARMFQRDQAKVNDTDSLRALMRLATEGINPLDSVDSIGSQVQRLPT